MGRINIEAALIADEAYFIEEVSRFLGISSDSIRLWEKNKKIPKAHRNEHNERYWSGTAVVKIFEHHESVKKNKLTKGKTLKAKK